MVRDLTKGGPTRLIISFACTMLLASMMNYIYNFTDSLMVGQFVNPDALGALSAASPFIMLINNLSFATLSGISIVIGQQFGAKDHNGMKRTMANAVYLTAVIIGVATVLSLIVCRPILEAMNTPDELLEMAVTYTSIIILAKPISAPSWLLSGLFRALGDAKTPVYISIINGFGNVVFNFLFLVVFPMGIAGAALGTLCASATGSLIYLIIFRRRMHLLHFGKEDAAISGEMIKRLLRIGIPLGLESSVTALSSLLLQTAVNGHGADVVTGIAIGGKPMSLFWIFFSVFESAMLAFCAQNIGAGQIERVRRGIRNTLLIYLIIGGVFFAFIISTLDQYLYMAFVGNNETILSYAHQYMMVQIAFFPCISILYAFRAGLKSFGSTVPTVLCGVIELIARVAVSVFFADNLMILFFAGPLAWLGTAIFLSVLYPIVCKRETKKILAQRTKEELLKREEIPTTLPEEQIPEQA
jgi:Na+-driven multidrug efflux pump